MLTQERLGLADTVFLHGNFYTLRNESERFDALAIKDGRILALGKNSELEAFIGQDTTTHDVAGTTGIPGFIDCHVHFEPRIGGQLAGKPNVFKSCKTPGDVEAVIREHVTIVAGDPEHDEWIEIGGELDRTLWPSRNLLDEIESNRPLIVCAAVRVYVLNSVAIQRAGITADTVVPTGGEIPLASDSSPTGLVLGRAIELVMRVNPTGSDAAVSDAILQGMERFAKIGVTEVHQMVRSTAVLRMYNVLRKRRRLPIRAGLFIRGYEAETQLNSVLNLGIQAGLGDDWVRIQGAKLSIDGSSMSRGGYFTEPYADAPTETGILRVTQEDLNDFVMSAHLAGIRCALHANGDHAVDMALTAYELADKARPFKDDRHRIEHIGNMFCTESQLEKMRTLHLVAVINPPFLYERASVLHELLGHDRAQHPVNVRDFISRGIPVIAASDTSGTTPPDPLIGISALVTRKVPSGQVFAPDQAVDVWQALRMYTTHAAWLGFEEERKGMLLPGRLADITLLSDDILRCAPEHIGNASVQATIVDGTIRYGQLN